MKENETTILYYNAKAGELFRQEYYTVQPFNICGIIPHRNIGTNNVSFQGLFKVALKRVLTKF